MQKKRRRGRTSTKTSVEDEIAHLRGLDLGGLRARWQGVFRRPAPAHLTSGTQNLSNGLFILKLPACRVAVVGLDLDLDRPIQPRRDNAGLDLDRVGPE